MTVPPSHSSEDDGHSLALPLDSDDLEFARGVEIGRLWEQFKRPEAFEQMIHAESAEMVLRIIETTHRRGHVDFTADDNWMVLIVEEQP